jgi:hypothetical protein
MPSFRHALWIVALGSVPGALRAGVVQWEFNGSLASSTGGAALSAEAAAIPGDPPSVAFTTATINGNLAQVASFSRGTYFRMVHGFAPNGGGAFVNQYTVVMDVMFPARSPDGYVALWQTSTTNADDGDWFINDSTGLGISGVYGGSVPDGTWHRLALVADHAGGSYTSFIDGVQVSQKTSGSTTALDGRTSLGVDALVFADGDDGENAAGFVNSLQITDRALSVAEIAALGGPTAAGIGAFFADDFEAYGSDDDLAAAGWQVVQTNSPGENASWTITNPGGRLNPPTENGSPSTGKFVVSDSDWADGENTVGSGMSHDLITPSFSTAGQPKVWLHADVTAQLNNNGDAVFDVDVSTDGGVSWTNILRRVAPARTAPPAADTTNADGFFGRLHLDLSAQAANQPDVRVRFRHFEPTDDWWIALDDVLVDGAAPPQGGNCVVLAAQDFSGGLGAMKAVSQTGSTGGKTWTTTDPAHFYLPGAVSGSSGRGVNRLNQPGVTPDFAALESQGDPDDESLLTPVLNCFSFNEVFLHYKSETVLEEAATQEVLLSLDGGATFPITVFSYNQAGGPANAGFDGGEDPFYSEQVFSVPQAAGQARVVFAFHYKSAGTARYWAVDDVQVTGSAPVCDPRPCGLRSFATAFDPASASVTGTWKSLPGDEGFQVFRGDAQIGGDLPAGTLSFVDASPPPEGKAIVYTLKPLLGGVVERECPAPAIDTFTCPSNFSARPDQFKKTVVLSWVPGSNLTHPYVIIKDGRFLTLAETPYVDTPPLTSTTEFNVFEYRLLVATEVSHAPCNDLSARAVISPGHVCFADDFESYADDVALEFGDWFRVDVVPDPVHHPGEDGTWTITNPGGRANPPTFDGKPSSGKFAISDSDFASGDNGAPGSGNSNDLWSPSFSCAGRSPVWLHLDLSAQLNNNGKAVFDVDVSTDGGVSWKNAYRRVAPGRSEAPPLAAENNVDGYFGRLDVDLTGLAAGKPNVRFRLRQFEPSDDWWIAVDNIIVDDLPAPAGGPVQILPTEDFSGGIPGDWTVRGLSPDPLTWTTSDPCNRSVANNGGGFTIFDGRGVGRLGTDFALLDSDCDNDQAPTPEDDYLITPLLDCSQFQEVYLHYKSEIDVSDAAIQEVLLSLDGGATFEPQPIFSYNGGGLFDGGEEPFYAERVFRTPLAAGSPSVAFGFHYKSAGNATWWAIDDVEVTGVPIPPTRPCEVTEVHAEAAAGGLSVSWKINTDPSGDGVADCACQRIDVRNSAGRILAQPPLTATSATLTGSCAELVGGASGKLCVVCIGPDSSEKEGCSSEITCGGTQKPGDCSQDGQVDISDAVCSLGYLFLGNPLKLPCGNGDLKDPANVRLLDSNGDGKIDLADAVGLLSYLFLGGVPSVQGTACVAIPDCPDLSAICK